MESAVNMFKGNPVRWLLIPDYNENESILIYYGNHAFIDGVQFFSMLQAMTVEKDFSQLPSVSPPSLWKRIKDQIILPWATVKAGYHAISLQ